MADFRLVVFNTVAKRSSFTKAAHDLFITQPAVTKHIRELEEQYKTKLFERQRNSITLTHAGDLLFRHSEEILALYRKVEFEINALSGRNSGILRIGASTTISQYVIPPVLAGFRREFPGVRIILVTGDTETIEQALIERDIDLGLIEGHSKDPQISYSKFLRDEIVLVCSSKHPLARQASVSLEQLRSIPLILRERGSGTLEVIEHALAPLQIKLSDFNIEIHLGSTEAMKSYLSYSSCMAFISVNAVSKELNSGELRIVDVANLEISRFFYMIHLQGKAEGLSDVFMRYSNMRLK